MHFHKWERQLIMHDPRWPPMCQCFLQSIFHIIPTQQNKLSYVILCGESYSAIIDLKYLEHFQLVLNEHTVVYCVSVYKKCNKKLCLITYFLICWMSMFVIQFRQPTWIFDVQKYSIYLISHATLTSFQRQQEKHVFPVQLELSNSQASIIMSILDNDTYYLSCRQRFFFDGKF